MHSEGIEGEKQCEAHCALDKLAFIYLQIPLIDATQPPAEGLIDGRINDMEAHVTMKLLCI